jgi:hypothetical protein
VHSEVHAELVHHLDRAFEAASIVHTAIVVLLPSSCGSPAAQPRAPPF